MEQQQQSNPLLTEVRQSLQDLKKHLSSELEVFLLAKVVHSCDNAVTKHGKLWLPAYLPPGEGVAELATPPRQTEAAHTYAQTRAGHTNAQK